MSGGSTTWSSTLTRIMSSSCTRPYPRLGHNLTAQSMTLARMIRARQTTSGGSFINFSRMPRSTIPLSVLDSNTLLTDYVLLADRGIFRYRSLYETRIAYPLYR